MYQHQRMTTKPAICNSTFEKLMLWESYIKVLGPAPLLPGMGFHHWKIMLENLQWCINDCIHSKWHKVMWLALRCT